MQQANSVVEIAGLLADRRYIDAEFMYKPRPEHGREQIVFDYALRSRLGQLSADDAVLFVCNSQQTIDSLAQFQREFPNLVMVSTVINPMPMQMQLEPQRRGGCRDKTETGDTPNRLGWEQPGQWQQMQTTDRWARVELALRVGGMMESAGYLVMPAQDAVWGQDLLPHLTRFSQRYAKRGLPVAVSPYTYHQHSAMPGTGIPQDIIDLLNTALSRDTLFPLKIRFDRVQAFWGKMNLTPFGMCQAILDNVDKSMWEDDLEIDRVIREQGYGLRCQWINNSQLYRQALPVFDYSGVGKVIERMLHYSLHIPGEPVGGSHLNMPLDWAGKIRKIISPRFRHYNAQSEALIAECTADIATRLREFGASWLDWGAYRQVVRVGHPAVEVWKRVAADQERI